MSGSGTGFFEDILPLSGEGGRISGGEMCGKLRVVIEVETNEVVPIGGMHKK